jgi:MFS family permease
MQTDYTDPKIKKGLHVSYFKGMSGCAMAGLTQDYLAPFLLFLGATAQSVGILNCLLNLTSSLIQFLGAELTERWNSRKKVIGIFVFWQAIMLIVLGIMTYLHFSNHMVVIFLIVLFSSFGSITNPPWISLLADLVEPNKRGQYFGWRARNLGLVTVFFSLVSGVILYQTQNVHAGLGFMIIFALACVYRFISFILLKYVYEPPLVCKKEDRFTFFQFVARLRHSNFAKFVFYVALMNFAVNIAAPFFSVFMLKDLSFNYLIYTAVIMAAPLTLYIMIGRWGRHADVVGNLKVLRVTGRLIAFIPLFWIFNHHPVYLCAVEMFSGFLWAGFNLCSINFIYDAVTPQKRTRCIAYFTVVNGLALAAGALLGSFLVHKVPIIFGYQILTLFLISSILRLLVGIIMPLFLKEVRHVKKIRGDELFFSMIGLKPILDK